MLSAALKTEYEQFLEILNLCGYGKLEQFSDFNETDFDNLEKYVRNYCQTIPMKERLRYMNDSFAKNPEVFTLNPLLKREIVKICQIITGQISLNRIMGTTGIFSGLLNFGNMITTTTNMTDRPTNSNLAIEDRILSEIQHSSVEIDDETDESSMDNKIVTKDISIIANKLVIQDKANKSANNLLLQSIPIRSQDINDNTSNSESINNVLVADLLDSSLTLADKNVHDLMVKFASEKLDCVVRINTDFNIYTSILDNRAGYYLCKLCPTNKKCKISFTNKNRAPVFWNLASHLRNHFSPSKIEQQSKSMKFDLNNVELLNEHHHEYVTKMAVKSFKSCNLKAKKDFCLYMSNEDKQIGYFVCNLCSKSLPNSNHFKFRFTMYESINFTNIKVHLLHHFEPSAGSPRGRKRKMSDH